MRRKNKRKQKKTWQGLVESWRKRKNPDIYITYDNCVIEKEFDYDKQNRF